MDGRAKARGYRYIRAAQVRANYASISKLPYLSKMYFSNATCCNKS